MSRPRPKAKLKIVRGDEAKRRYYGKSSLAYNSSRDALYLIEGWTGDNKEFEAYDKITDTYKDEWFCVVIDDTPDNNEYGEVCP